jgi:tRNA-specific 2-thiouridylase
MTAKKDCKPKALIAMSGGVDSSVALLLTQEQGYECRGVTMKLYNNDLVCNSAKTCCSLDDVEDARSVCVKRGIPYNVFNFQAEFKTHVIDKFIKAYEEGATPNPCIDCNRYLKFETLFERAKVLGFEKIVTGHYARIEKVGDRYLLKKAVDSNKDQSYVLYSMTQEQLAKTIFPLGELTKAQTREIASRAGFINANKSESQDICFVPDGDYASFIERTKGKQYPEGDFIDKTGKVIGKHKGIIRYTKGQRKGLGIAAKKPLYVCKKNLEDNTIVLGFKEDLTSLECIVSEVNYISQESFTKAFRAKVKTRYRQKEQWATITPIDKSSVKVVFDEPLASVTKGQAAVFYDGDIVIGGGVIN